MNVPPVGAPRVSVDRLRDFAVALFQKAGVPDTDARLITGLLIDTDLRGVLSHGTRTIDHYLESFLDGRLNPAPQVRVVCDDPTTAVVDGDGGLGHPATHRATQLAIDRAREHGLGAAVSRYHGHFGSAGKYSRMCLREGLVALCTSGHTMGGFDPDTTQWNPLGNPPMSFAFPGGEEAPVHLDMGTSWFQQEDFDGFFDQAPAAFFKSIGLVASAHMLGGVLAGMMDPERLAGARRWSGASMGGFVLAMDVARFVPVADFRAEVDRTQREVRELSPYPGQARWDFPGGPEFDREPEWRRDGIPLGDEHRESLEQAARRVSLNVPWD